MKRTFPIFLFLLPILTAATAQVASHAPTVFTQAPGPGAASANPVGKAVARVNGVALTEADLLREEYAIFPYGRQHNGIPKDLEPEVRAGALKMIVFEELVYQEALRRKMTVSAARLQRSEADFRKTFASPDEFNAFMQSEFHGSEALLQQKVRRSLLIDSLLKAEIDAKVAISPAELKAYYDSNPIRFERPESFTFQTISILPPEKPTSERLSEQKKRAQDALRQAKATKSSEEFGLLAEKISDDDYRVMMGQHKPVPAKEIAPQVVKALLAMKSGEVSDLMEVGQIYTIIRLQEHTLAGKVSFEQVKPQLEKELPKTKKEQLRELFDKKLRQDAKIEVL